MALPPLYYTFPLSFTPHPFMGLGKVMAGRIHQMKAYKSYLAAHPSWSRVDEPRHCPRCGEEEETFNYAILGCQSTSYQRGRLIKGLSDVGPDSPLWSDKELLLALAAFIEAEGTGYPPTCSPPSLCHWPRWSSPHPCPVSRKGCFPHPLPTPFEVFSCDGFIFPYLSEMYV